MPPSSNTRRPGARGLPRNLPRFRACARGRPGCSTARPDEDFTESLEVSYDRDSALPILFRYLVMRAGGFDDLFYAVEDMALAQYFWKRKGYDEIWADKIPYVVREWAGEIASQLGEVPTLITVRG